MPPEEVTGLIEQDYNAMQNMIFGDTPGFSEMMDAIQNLEREINGLDEH